MVIAYKRSKFQKHNLAPIEDWKDLWQLELAGRISMVNSPREVIGLVLKYMGASYNSNDIDSQVAGGKIAVQQNLALLAIQVRMFDSTHYLKAFGIGDVWVSVGWSSDVLPAVKRMSNVAVVVPKTGASLWANLWAIPAASRLETKQIGGRVRGPSPLIHQWIEFCLQIARALPFKQEVIPGASPSALESTLVKLPEELLKGKPSLDTNLISGVPRAEILARCEFLEPLSEATLSGYEWLVGNLQKTCSCLGEKGAKLLVIINPKLSSKSCIETLMALHASHYNAVRAIGSGQLGQSITSSGKEASATLNITGCTKMAEVLEVLGETKDESLFEQSCCQSFRVREERSRSDAADFFIIVASIVEVSSFEAVYAYAFSLLKYRKLEN